MECLKLHNKTAISWKGQDISYADLFNYIKSYSKKIESKPNNVAVFMENRPEWIYSFYSGWFLDSTMVPIDYMSSADEVAYILNDCKPEYIFTSNNNSEVLNAALENTKYNPVVINIDETEIEYNKYDEYSFPKKDLNEEAVIIYTSGTTGQPKGVVLTFQNLMTNIDGVSKHIKIYKESSVVLILLPLHHTFPLIGSMVAPLFVGGKVAISPSLKSEDIMETLQSNNVTIIIGVPRFYSLLRKGIKDKINQSFATKALFNLAKSVNSRKFSQTLFKKVHDKFGGHIEVMVSGGAALDKAVGEDFKTLGFEMLEGYGMTEAAPMISFTRPGRWVIGAAGEVLPGCEIKIQDGEILAKGPNIMKGYFNKPEDTAEIIKDGWLHTGDLGKVDEKGFVFITGRKKEIIVLSNGKNINPVEIEFKLESLSDYISEVAVFNKNDQLHAIFYPNFAKLSSDEVHNIDEHFTSVIEKYNMNVASVKRLVKFHIVKEELPKTRLGKVKRFLLEEMIENKTKKEVDPEYEESKEYNIIKNFLEKNTEQNVYPTDHIEIDLGLDSLDKVNFLAFLHSTFGIELEENSFNNYSTVEQIAKMVEENKTKISVGKINWSEILKDKLDIKLPTSWFTHSLIKYFTKIFFKAYFRFKGEGMENIPNSPCIITPNHQSYFDGLFITALLKRLQLKRTLFYAKEKHLRRKWQKFLAQKHNVIVMDINKDLKQSIQKMAAAIQKGKNIIIFPEGTRTKDGSLGKFKKTFAILSRELNVPVVPVSIKGAFEALPTGGKLPKPFKKVSVKFSDPIYPENHSYESLQDEVYKRVLSNIQEKAA